MCCPFGSSVKSSPAAWEENERREERGKEGQVARTTECLQLSSITSPRVKFNKCPTHRRWTPSILLSDPRSQKHTKIRLLTLFRTSREVSEDSIPKVIIIIMILPRSAVESTTAAGILQFAALQHEIQRAPTDSRPACESYRAKEFAQTT